MTLAEKIAKACAIMGTHTPEDIEAAINAGQMGNFCRGETVVIVTVNTYPRRQICELFMIVGDLDVAWDLVDEEIGPWARHAGCDGILGRGRDGWRKRAKERGWWTGTIALLNFTKEN